MKVLEEPKKQVPTLKIRCKKCEALFELSNGEYAILYHLYGSFYHGHCPCCKTSFMRDMTKFDENLNERIVCEEPKKEGFFKRWFG